MQRNRSERQQKIDISSAYYYIAPRMKQQSLFSKEDHKRYGRTAYGGLPSKGHRKLERPFASNKWVHLILKSDKARGQLSLLGFHNQTFIRNLVYEKAKKFGVDLADFVNVGNHLHLKVRAATKIQFQKFLKSISSLIARHVTKARRGHRFGRFWQNLAYTRVLKTRAEELRLGSYFSANRLETVAGKARRDAWLKDFNQYLRDERRQSKSAFYRRPPDEQPPPWA